MMRPHHVSMSAGNCVKIVYRFEVSSQGPLWRVTLSGVKLMECKILTECINHAIEKAKQFDQNGKTAQFDLKRLNGARETI